MSVFIIETGIANTASVASAFTRLGASVERGRSPTAVRDSAFVVLPGVGSFAAGMASLRAASLVGALQDRVAMGRPTLAVCLGLQLLCEGSDEAPGLSGLGLIPGRLTRFTEDVRVPQLGWNGVETGAGARLLTGGAAYYANSYRLSDAPEGWGVAWSDHGGRFVAALERGRVLACQLHPELSGTWGLDLLRRWLEDEPAPVCPPTPVGPRLIPCLDVRNGRVVKGVRFQDLRDAGDPVEQAAAYAAQGADELAMLDVSATPEGRSTALETCAAIRAVLPVPLTVGGGVRTVDDAARLLTAGADKIAVNTAAVEEPSLLDRLAERFGRQCVVLAVDAARTDHGWEVVTRSGRNRTGLDAVAWVAEAAKRGAGEVLLTSWDRDGTGSGYDLGLLRAVRASLSIPVIASGGGKTPAHLAAAVGAGADALLAASIFHDRETTVEQLKNSLRDEQGVEVRL